MEGSAFTLEGGCFDPLVENRALVTLASSPGLEWGRERTGTQNPKPAGTEFAMWDKGCC